ncbi:choice-of-anchor J domain-containing protein, partial [Fluviicola sp.]|uniref:choice-of-anchor J domain-containing protein n=1 Tax=Fluviicola sp. TaxID=1917219 RepID=UPI00262307CC
MKTRILTITACLFGAFMLSGLSSKSFAQSYTESFDDITLLAGNGWLIQNNSTPVGSISWFQGTATSATPTPGPFNSYTGAPNSYIGVNFNSTGSTGTISNWLITPNRTLRNGDVFTFYTRKPTIGAGQTDYPDRLEVRLSTNGASTNVGAGAAATGDFTTLLLSVNPTLVANVYPQVWTQYTITISGLPAPTSGRIAFRYFVSGAGSLGSNSDYIGIDQVVYTPYVCPAFTMTAGGALTGGTAGSAYSNSLTQTGALGAPSYAVTAGALPPGMTLSAGGTISGTPTATGTFNFTATVSDASGCSGSQAYSITVVCPANPITMTAAPTLCNNGSGYTLVQGSPAGGTYSGTGVSGGVFAPASGTQTIT